MGQGECRRSRRFDGAKQTRLCFCALLTEGEARVRFYRESFGRHKNDLA